MAIQPKPWYRASKDAWYVQHRGRQVRLSKGKHSRAEALQAFYQLMAAEPPAAAGAGRRAGDAAAAARDDTMTVVELANLFLDWSQKRHEPGTYAWHKHFLGKFCNFKGTGRMRAAELRPFDVNRWVDANPRWNGGRRTALQIVKRAFSWAEDEGLLGISPIRKMKLPPCGVRQRYLTEGERREILASVQDDAFRDFLRAMQESGCRPSEVARVTAADVDLALGVWTFKKHKTSGKTNSDRIIYLSPPLLELTGQLMLRHPTGALFRNKEGKPFTGNAIRCRFRRIAEKLPHLGRVQIYLYRHSYITDALERGVPVAQVATLVGHTSTEMIMRRYSKLRQRVAHMREAAALVTAVPQAEGAAPA